MEITEKIIRRYQSYDHDMSHLGNHKTRLAEILAKQLAVILCIPDGEDSSGRQKLKLMEPKDVVTRCNDMSEEFFNQWTARGWMLEVVQPIKSEE